MQRFHAGVRKFKTKSGQPMLLTPNWGIGGSQRYDDPEVLAVGNASDGALSECGFTGCASACPAAPASSYALLTLARSPQAPWRPGFSGNRRLSSC